MALSLSNFLYAIALLIPALCSAATVVYDFNITWTTANPDGQFERSVMSINNTWPIPTIHANVGDNIIVNAFNGLGNVTTSLHFHGLFQNGTTSMDGPIGTTQCGIPPGSLFTYNFTINQPGTYWYHSHARMQYGDGLRGPLIVTDPEEPFKSDYDEELVLTLSDWYHQLPSSLLAGFMSYTNPTGAEPVPEAALINDTQNLQIEVKPGKTYKFRIINMSVFAGMYLWFEGHNMSIIEVDGTYSEPTNAELIYLGAAQRCSILITMKNETDTNFAITGSMDTSLFDTVPASLNTNVTGWLVYDINAAMNNAPLLDEFVEFDDSTLIPYDKKAIFPEPDHTITLDLTMNNLGDGVNYAFFNQYTYVDPKVPTLYSALTTANYSTDPTVYGTGVNPYVLEKNQVIEIVVNNQDSGKHPLHLHGHNFQVVVRSEENADPEFYYNNITLSSAPIRRDTIVVNPLGYVVLRFVADNPGIWLFHCHIDWHMSSGLAATMIEAPLDLQANLKIPQDHYDACAIDGVPTSGNAAGNTKDFYDLKGANVMINQLPSGFTARGIVALVFSCVAAFVGIAIITLYGLQPIGTATQAAAERQIAEADLHDGDNTLIPVTGASRVVSS